MFEPHSPSLCLAAACMVRAGDMCPAPPKYQAPIASDIAADDHRIHIDSDDAEVDADGNAVLNGRVKVRQDARSVTADSVTYDDKTGHVAVKGSVDFEDPKLRVQQRHRQLRHQWRGQFRPARIFSSWTATAAAIAKDIDVLPDGKVTLSQVRYTSLSGRQRGLDAAGLFAQHRYQGTGRHRAQCDHARSRTCPIFYTPYISFPVGR